MRINTRGKVAFAAGFLGIAALFGSATAAVAATPAGMPSEAHVAALAPQVMPDPARPAGMPAPARPAGMPDPAQPAGMPDPAQPANMPQG
jgi:hypothetical protein